MNWKPKRIPPLIVLSISLSGRTKTKEQCFLCKCKEAHLRAILFENYELSFRQTNDLNGLSTTGLRKVYTA
jgi:hypothetical protein